MCVRVFQEKNAKNSLQHYVSQNLEFKPLPKLSPVQQRRINYMLVDELEREKENRRSKDFKL